MKNSRILITFLLHSALFQAPCKAFVITDYINVFTKTVKTYFMVTTGKPQELEVIEAYFDNKLESFSVKDLLKTKSTITVNSSSKITSEHGSFVAHMQLLQELKARIGELQEKTKSHVISPVTDVKLTQTEAYLKYYQREVNRTFRKDYYPEKPIEKYKDLIDQIISKEKELSNTHYFFYHAHDRELIILHDFMKLLHTYMQLIGPRLDFTCIRLKGLTQIPYKNVDEFLDAHTYFHNYDQPIQSYMLSVNLALFGSHTNIKGCECTFEYFFNNRSMFSSGLLNRLSEVFSHYGLDKKYIPELIDLTSHLTSPTGNLLQICIPHDMVDDLVYLAKPGGMPYNTAELAEHYDYDKKRHTSIRPLLEHMRTAPHKIYNLSHWQARLMFFDPILDIHPGIKVFRYNTITPENAAIYQQKLRNIVTRLILDYLKTSDISGKQPLHRLHYYYKQIQHKDIRV